MNEQPEWIDVIKTKPMQLRELAEWFDVSTRHIKKILASIEGVQKIGGRWRVPVKEMPVGFLMKMGLIVPERIKPDQAGHLLHGSILPNSNEQG